MRTDALRRIRHKDTIDVLFVVYEVSKWKTEMLYKLMLEDNRFNPIIGITLLLAEVPSMAAKKYSELQKYLQNRGYQWVELQDYNLRQIKPDIIFYTEPYDICYPNYLLPGNQVNSLLCFASYAFNTISAEKWANSSSFHCQCFQTYYENQSAIDGIILNKAKKRAVLTGLPFSDELMKPKDDFIDIWKSQNKHKKRIIWAPHHTITNGLLHYSTFLDIALPMLEIAKKYQEKVQFAFKPHPVLYRRLVEMWGKEKADNYYAEWNRLENCQISEGYYIDLFKHSDALIHDCGSFTIEYQYIDKPVMYLVNGEPHTNNLNEYAKKAYDIHVKGCNQNDIEKFIESVIAGEDNFKNERHNFIINYLIPPNNKTASENIIDALITKLKSTKL